MIFVRQIGEGDPLACTVDIDGTHFDVTLDRGDLERLGTGRPASEVVTAAFRFLLDREPKDAILRQFDLSEISRYFPEFEKEILGYFDKTDDTGRAT